MVVCILCASEVRRCEALQGILGTSDSWMGGVQYGNGFDEVGDGEEIMGREVEA
jgi:hypothetical protein